MLALRSGSDNYRLLTVTYEDALTDTGLETTVKGP